MKNKRPELLAPAGDWASLHAALKAGADSVYFGIKGINMRHLASNFDTLEIPRVMQVLKKQNCRGYLTLNTIILNKDLPKVKKILKTAKAAEVDAVILWDMSVLSLAKEMDIPFHISTQVSVSNINAFKTYAALGAKRIVLARECTLKDIANIIQEKNKKNIDCEVETFIHGAMCVSISGRCFLSQYSFNKSANQGKCFQPCRRKFHIKDIDGESEYIVGEDYILSPRDLCTIDFLDELIKTGIDSFKIEGRIRSPEYIRVVTATYKEAINCFFKNQLGARKKKLFKDQLNTVYNRGFSSGFYFGKPNEPVSQGIGHVYEKIYIGHVTRFFKKINVAEIRLRAGDLNKGDQVLFIGKSTPAEVVIADELQCEHQYVDHVPKGESVGIKLPFTVKSKDKVFLWRMKKK